MIDTEKWRVHIECGYNILLFGIGSKKSILLKLLKTADFNDFHRFFVDLNSPKLNLFKILEEIYSKISKTSDLGNRKKIAKKANLKIKGKGVISICKDLKKIMKQSKTKVLLILNSLDNANCDFKNILALSRMASFESVRVIASCETFNIEPLTDSEIFDNFNFIWEHHPTDDFSDLRFRQNLQNSTKTNENGLVFVFKSLTPSQKDILSLFGPLYFDKLDEKSRIFSKIDNKNENSEIKSSFGVPIEDLYEAAFNELIISSESALKSSLKEMAESGLVSIEDDLVRPNFGEEIFK